LTIQELPGSDAVLDAAGSMQRAIVTQRIEVAPGLIILRVAADGWELPDFIPGQYAVIGLPGCAPRCAGSDAEPSPDDPRKLIRRAYSIASSSVARQYLEFYVTLVKSGELTPRLFGLGVGDRLWLGRKITGMFTLDQVPAEANLVLVATGTGVAPYMSMVRTVLSMDCPRRFAILHGAQHSWDLGYHAELVTLQRVCPRLTYIPIVSRPKDEVAVWAGKTGYCQDLWTSREIARAWGFDPTPENTHVFLCGNPAMIENMIHLLTQAGFREHSNRSPGEIHLEKYW
jgi:ferredoxin/flavodoxin---NADP+ reductase